MWQARGVSEQPVDPAPTTLSAEAALPVGLRLPAHRVNPRAIGYWRTISVIESVIGLAVLGTLWWFFGRDHWWASAILVLAVVWSVVDLVVAPKVRYEIHRWEVDDVAVHTRVGFLSVESRIAPLNRVQTVDSQQGPVMRMFNLATITVTTASSAGAIEIAGLDADEAKAVVAHLTTVTAASEGDAT